MAGCGVEEMSSHLFFDSHIASMVWCGVVKWPGVVSTLHRGCCEHLVQFDGLPAVE